MNCYNSARYLREALESVRAQTFSSWEIVFWDNRSTDESAGIFRSFGDPRFRYFLAPEHTQLGAAKNLAIGQARGEWLAFLDCDDLWLPHKLERQVVIVSEEGPELGLVYGGMEILVENEARKTSMGRSAFAARCHGANKALPEGDIFAALLQENIVPQPTAMVRRSVYQSVGGVDQGLKHAWDYDLFVKISRVSRVRAVQETVSVYRIHGTNLSHTQTAINYGETIAIISRYLPSPEAQRGMRSQQTTFAVNEMRQGHVLDGLRRVVIRGDLALFSGKFMKYIWRYFVRKINNFLKTAF